MPYDQGRPRTGVRSVLLLLVLTTVAPMLLLACGYAWWNLQLQDRLVNRGLQDTVRALSLAVDREVQTVEAALSGLAGSPHLDAGQLDAFHAQAKALGDQFGGWVVLTAPSMQMLVNTLRPPGETLPTSSQPEIIASVLASGKPAVTGLFFGRVAKRPALAAIIAVMRDGRTVATLDMSFYPDRFAALLADQHVPDGWTSTIADHHGVIIAEAGLPSAPVGTPAPAWLIDGSRDLREGILQTPTAAGEDRRLAFVRSEKSGWVVAVSAPESVLSRSTRQAAMALGLGGIASLLLSLGFALLLGRHLARPLRGLAVNAAQIVRGEHAALPPPRLQELADLKQALVQAGQAHRDQVETRLRLAQERRAREAVEQAALAVRASEERYRGLTDAIASVVWTTGPKGLLDAPASWCALTGQSPTEAAGFGWLQAFHPDDRASAEQAWREALQQGRPWDVEHRLRVAQGGYRWYNVRAVPVVGADGGVREWVGVCIDIDGRKIAEQRQALLLAELDHRVRNMLSSIQAMISLTGASAESKKDYAERLLGRISAMGRTHGLLTRQRWRGASLTRILRDELRPYTDNEDGLALIGAPDCILPPRDALSFALVIHELATNAAKYGALSVTSGRVTIDWRLDAERPADLRLLLEWRESGGPPVVPPTRRGFGSRLMESALSSRPDASVSLDFDPLGVRCRIVLPLRADDGGAVKAAG